MRLDSFCPPLLRWVRAFRRFDSAERNHVHIEPLPVDIEAFVLAEITDTHVESEGKRFRQTQQLLGLDLVGGTCLQKDFQQPGLQVENRRRHLSSQEKMALCP